MIEKIWQWLFFLAIWYWHGGCRSGLMFLDDFPQKLESRSSLRALAGTPMRLCCLRSLAAACCGYATHLSVHRRTRALCSKSVNATCVNYWNLRNWLKHYYYCCCCYCYYWFANGLGGDQWWANSQWVRSIAVFDQLKLLRRQLKSWFMPFLRFLG